MEASALHTLSAIADLRTLLRCEFAPDKLDEAGAAKDAVGGGGRIIAEGFVGGFALFCERMMAASASFEGPR